ncbi:pantothenate kinase 4-like protein [Labeo rohita]|uniref:Pantothenate kinase 4-like protein n=1 Tax=Labeo rohita TaxID=84645 RepID=A0A498P0F2_LABRO|nr:pantothenate kinase 4-like protein [Labeo rohita]
MALSGGADRGSHSMDKSITLPPDEIFRNLENAKRFAIDIGGSLTKLAYYSTVQHKVAKVRSFDHSAKGEVQALFLRHEGYLGAIGAFLKGAEEDNPNQYSWGENYAGSSGLMSVSPDLNPVQRARSGTVSLHKKEKKESI